MSELKLVRLSEIEPKPYPDRSQALPGEAIRWGVLTREEPELKRLQAEIKAVDPGDDPHFCANEVWYSYGRHRGFRDRLFRLVGWEARNPKLRSEAAYDLAYQRLYGLLPYCRDCWCVR